MYSSEAHNLSSTIDHTLPPAHLLTTLSKCFMVEDGPLNLSDHSPHSTFHGVLLPPVLPQSAQPIMSHFRPIWSKLSNQKLLAGYTNDVDTQLSKLSLPSLTTLVSSSFSIDSLLAHDILLTAAHNHVPPKYFRSSVNLTPRAGTLQVQATVQRVGLEWVSQRCTNLKRKRYRDEIWPSEHSRANTKETKGCIFLISPQQTVLPSEKSNGAALEPTTKLKLGEYTYTGNDLSEAWASYFQNLSNIVKGRTHYSHNPSTNSRLDPFPLSG